MERAITITSHQNPHLQISAIPGHFVTSHSHISHYVDLTVMKHQHMMAQEAGLALAESFAYHKEIDTIVCIEGSEVIGAFLARGLAKSDLISVNRRKELYVITPEFNSNMQLIFRDNLEPMIHDKNILLLIPSITTGKAIHRTLEGMAYYGAHVQGIAAVFSAQEQVDGVEITRLFSALDIPGYETYSYRDCPYCKAGQKIDGLANSFGISHM
ncbi:MAG: orotate phosphoribosyltransferase [Anaerotruncus sp.]|jgi:orotate phosphoribosyltransferase|nr:orotate phosphoribosyltransferase [Anaerotruncus sp.]